jgi:hypothetical protein
VPDVILQVISEILAESSSHQQQANNGADESTNGSEEDVVLIEDEDVRRRGGGVVLNQQASVSGSSIARVMSNYQPNALDTDGRDFCGFRNIFLYTLGVRSSVVKSLTTAQ